MLINTSSERHKITTKIKRKKNGRSDNLAPKKPTAPENIIKPKLRFFLKQNCMKL